MEPLIRKGQRRETDFGEDTGLDLRKSLRCPQDIRRRCPGKRRNPAGLLKEEVKAVSTKWVRSGLGLKVINGI